MIIQPHMIAETWGSLNEMLPAKQDPIMGTGFFPTRQYDIIRSETTQPAGGTGTTFRETLPENQSMIESNWWANMGWLNSPYEADKAVPAKVAESKQLAATVEPPRDPLAEGLDWALSTSVKAATLYDQIKTAFSPREVISETPRAGYPDGRDVRHTNDMTQRSAEVYQTGRQLYDQVRGLFNLGFEQAQAQPAAAITTGGIGIGTIALLVLLYLLLR